MKSLRFLLFGLFSAVVVASPPANNTGRDLIDQYNCTAGVGRTRHDDVIREDPMGRNGMLDERLRWPGGRIPYLINPGYNEAERFRIIAAAAEFTRLTNHCIRLEARKENDANYVVFTQTGSGCNSWLGMVGGPQNISLDSPGCMLTGSILHEIMHAVGFDHEQNRPDRDDWVNIHLENVKPGLEFNFNKWKRAEASSFGEPYDFTSVMHYGPCAFNDNGKATITPKDGIYRDFGWAETLSASDVRRIKRMYKCPL